MSTLSARQQLRQQLVWSRLLAVVEEQAQALIRTAFGTPTREAGDLSAGVFLPDGRMVAQAVTGTPGHVNSMADSVLHFLRAFPIDTMRDGDVFVTNDPWKGTGHLFDVVMVTPVFHGEDDAKKAVALFASTVHVVDIGGVNAGPDALEIFHEGLFLPPLRFASQGVIEEAVLDIVRANVREPGQVEGDFHALVACNAVGAVRLQRLLREFKLADLQAQGDYIIERSRLAMREALREWPTGTWRNHMTVDGYDAPLELHAAVTITDEGILVDFAGTSASIARGINVPKAYTDAYTSFGIRCLVGADVPNNSGSLAPIRVVAPEGSIVNALPPAAVAARAAIGQMLPDLVFGALRQARPDRVPAEGASSLWNIRLFGGQPIEGGPNDALRRARRFNIVSFSTGGTGARPGKDGLSATAYPSGVRNVSLEILETQAPLLFRRKEYRPDSGGVGTSRGGLGQVIEIENADGDPMVLSATWDRVRFPARGALGGADGAPGAARLKHAGTALRGKGRQVIPAGEVLVVETPGGAGLGDPAERDAALVARDLKAGLVTQTAASPIQDFAGTVA
ncbi:MULTISPECIES: hydantoinase B/oxoprolinase family protein [Variovorax]|jgi:N-methylhydantoinase B|uniref:hydantoinase B/oxoprolinase family protein n=1 Tax=Variovorax TaxID=34072 RepID=UPI00086D00C1|nr:MULTISPECIES: hydantoinase B/oxoprolinase family protein [Variovorax]MBN8755530.1 hydantoinase B/oxoprolinase family protein [Variovorax sp.]ODU19102.1 MAG: 5-oxoprolinase [Variovorax sp. SCN 67-85]ODV23463.1 MAG: 5-oxoprolinase [Variovorax sp. SCN 67-20]OJZ16101.1 MAG: 5-oxoprolinase [Variovorax sp. 67-131]UKI07548.1 hydantoinase B/oxoprolinase family protein [Variovorax paradoxus]